MSSTQVAHSDLDRAFIRLESLLLNRPPHVLLAEYLSALTAEEVLDADGAAHLLTTSNGLRYSALPVDDSQVGEAVASLTQITDRLAAMNPEERGQIAQRVRDRIQRPGAEQPPNPEREHVTVAPQTFVPPARHNHSIRQSPSVITIGDEDDLPFELSGPRAAVVTSLPQTNRRRATLPRVSLELAALIALATFFGGYFLRDAANKVADASALPAPFTTAVGDEKGQTRTTWLDTVRAVGDREAQAANYGKARQALELALTYSQTDDETLLNNLAWYYLLPDKSGTNPQRALVLVNRALKLQRRSEFLDTAAEAHFQLGDFPAAIRLENEAISAAPEQGGVRNQLQELKQRLQKFQTAEAPAAEKVTASSK